MEEPSRVYSPEEIERLIKATGENDNVDAKGPMTWDKQKASAGLTKDILAFANSRDGGAIVIGKSENGTGGFNFEGLTVDQASSFETTKVATWVNSKCAPPVRLECCTQKCDGKTYVVIQVAEFDDVPILCTKQYQDIDNNGKSLLRKGALYIRNANAESAPLTSVEELRTLIGLATTKQGDKMLAMFSAMMKGRPLLDEVTDEEKWGNQIKILQSSFDDVPEGETGIGAWSLSFHPQNFQEELWEDISELKSLLSQAEVRIREPFPYKINDSSVHQWGICSHDGFDTVGLARSGLFLAKRIFIEDIDEYSSPLSSVGGNGRKTHFAKGEWIHFEPNIYQVAEIFLFMSRFAHSFEPGEKLIFELAASPLKGRYLVSDSAIRWALIPPGPCNEHEFRFKRTVGVEELQANWKEQCAKVLLRFFELFAGQQITKKVIMDRIDRFENRRV